MKILRITLSNIASLAGQHTVDFTQEPLCSAGLYAICGDTGSGKSSLLDAMCLALYGKTPRLKDSRDSLEKINKDEKQLDPRTLLRRGTAEGLAEVAFVGVDGESWTARWTVRRARRSVSGKLQQVDRTLFQGHIAPAGDGTIKSGGKKTEVDAAIQEKLGLTFDQFTRAVLLAQNEFAVFLKSDDKTRAEILQALTGTGRFEDISKAVFERCKVERRLIDELKAQLKGGTVLPEERRLAKQTQLAEITKQLTDVQTQRKQLETEQEWHQKLASQNESLTTTQNELNVATTALTASAPRKRQLQFTEQALRHAAPRRQAVRDSSATLKQCSDDAKNASNELKQREETHKLITAEFEAAEAKLLNAKQQTELLQPKLIEAARLEETIRLHTVERSKANDALTKATTASQQANKEQQQTRQQTDQAKSEQQQLQRKQKKVQIYQPFADAAGLWLERLKQAADTNRKAKDLAAEVKQHQQQLEKLREHKDKATAAWKEQSEERATAKRKLDKAEEAAKEFDRDEWIEQRNSAEERRELWDSFHTHLKAVHGHEIEQSDCQQKLVACMKVIAQQDTELKQLVETDLPLAQQAFETQTTSLQTVQSAISNEAVRLRTQLRNEQPCSVCGSTQHPYSAQPPSSDQTAVAALQQLLKNTETELNNLTQRQSQLKAERKANTTRHQEYETRLKEITKELADFSFPHCDHSEIQPLSKLDIVDQIKEADRQRNEIAEQVRHLKAKEQQAAAVDKEVAITRRAFENARQKERDAQDITSKSEQRFATTATDQKNLEQRFDELETQQQNEQLPLQELFAQIPNSKILFESNSEAFRTSFADSVSLVGKVTKQLSDVEADLKQLHVKLNTIEPIATKATELLETRRKEADTIQAQLTDLQQQQSAVFGGRTAAAAEGEVTVQRDAAEKQRKRTEQACSQSQKSLAMASQDVVQTEKQKAIAKDRGNQSAEALAVWRSEFNATHNLKLSETDLDEMLDRDEAWLKSEAEFLQALSAAVQTKIGQLETLQGQHKALLDSRPSELTLEQITSLQEAATEQHQSLQQSKEDVQKDLNVDDAQRKNNETTQRKISEQEKTASPWMRLNEVIGSSDGSAFRNIAQRHTLDILLQFSNHQLRLLSGRYRLERVPNSLNLMVVDQDMADERRSIYSLSGGESFLVSLALALGLASLTSNRLKIESLFIDEGFGSLDPNTLDLAMNALMHLESQGRKVGVISHVTTMTDAIPVQIKVTKGASGASTIDVPTVTHVREKPTTAIAATVQQSLFSDPEA